ncbi:MAG: peptidylprolyl isomerase [Phycisphaerales bacterium]|nr:peptidylprolyl isomerase [Phycisphaerales bacterium]
MKKLIPIAVLALGIAVFAAVAFVQPETTEATSPEATQPVATPSTPEQVQEDTLVYIAIETTMGTIYLGLNETKAPISTENFLAYLDEGFYEKTIFHRVMKGFMIQGGGFEEGLKKKEPKEGIKNEWKNGLKNTRGTIAMARLGRQPDSGTSQFFINLADNAFLDQPRDGAGYAVFGHVVKGLDVLDAIGSVHTSPQGMHGDAPTETILIKTVTRVTDKQAAELELAGTEN